MTDLADVWAEKYRPKTWDELVGQNHLKDRLSVMTDRVASGDLMMPNLAFTGRSGTGKTTSALILIKAIVGDEKPLVLNASKDRGIQVIRDKVSEFVQYKPLTDIPFKIAFMDEADKLTKEAQWALRAIMENHTKVVRFILCCEEYTKIIPAIQSRVADAVFLPLSVDDISEYLLRVVRGEGIDKDPRIHKDAIRLIAEYSNGNVRMALNKLALVVITQPDGQPIGPGAVREFCGYGQEASLTKEMFSASDSGLIPAYYHARANGLTPNGMFNYIISHMDKMQMDPRKHAAAIKTVADTDYRIRVGASEDIQIIVLLKWLRNKGLF